jgi:hypothetical protein
MRDYQTKANAGGAPDSITSTKLGAGEVNSILTENENAVERAGLTLANAAGAGEDTTQLAQSLFIHAVKSSSFADSGSANAYQLTPTSGSNGVLLPGNYATLNGARIYFVPGNNNTGNTTINIGQTVGTLLGAKKALRSDGSQLPSGALVTTRMTSFVYDAAADSGTGAWILDGSYDASSGQFLPLTGGTMSGAIAMGNNKVTGLADGTATGDAVNKGQLDLKSNINSPTFTGTPAAPTAAVATDTTQIATTEFVKDASIGWGQTWQDVTGSRAANTNYTNTTGKPIGVAISLSGGVTNNVRVDGVVVGNQVNGGVGFINTIAVVVPAGSVYRLNVTTTFVSWVELR